MSVELTGAFLLLTQANGGAQYMKLYALDTPGLGGAPGDFIEVEPVYLNVVVGTGSCVSGQ